VKWPLMFQVFCLLFFSLGAAAPAQMDKSLAPAPKPLLLVVNQGDHTLSLIDPDAGQELAKVCNSRKPCP